MRTDREFCARLIERVLAKGAHLAEVYQKASRLLSVEVREGEVEAVETAVSQGYGLRVIKDGRLGFSYSNSPEDMERVAQTALETAEFTERDEFLVLPGPSKPGTPEVRDPEVEDMKEDEAVKRARLIEKTARAEDSRIRKTRKASASFSSSDTLVVNSRGVDYGYCSTFLSAQITVVAQEGEESQMGWDYRGGRFLQDVDFEAVGREAARRALSMLGARRITARKAPVVLDCVVAAELLSVLASMLSSETVQKGKSLLKGRMGQPVVSSLIDIIDDGLLAHGPGTRDIDDEGVPTSEHVLIEEGVLRGYMYNTRTAKKDGVASTGNAVRAGYSSVPSVGPTNLYISSRSNRVPLGEMLGSAEAALYVLEAMGVHTANPISGEFSIGVSGLWLEGGKAAYPVKEAVVSGNLLDFFGKVRAVGEDLRFLGGIGSPSLLVGPTDISA
jgi:PmbA protein